MKVLLSLSARAGIVKGSRVAVRQGSWYWLGTVTRKGAADADVQYDEGSKGKASLRSLTHLPDSAKTLRKPQTKEQIDAIKEKAKAASVTKVVKADEEEICERNCNICKEVAGSFFMTQNKYYNSFRISLLHLL